MKFTKATALVGAALAAATFAAAPPASATTTSLATCSNSYNVWANYDANVYSGWDSYRVVGHVGKNMLHRCVQGYKLGRRYTACGISDGNGWLLVLSDEGTWGYSPQGCFSDV